MLSAFAFSIVKFVQRRKGLKRPVKEDINDTYGMYDTSGEQSEYSTVQDNNEYYAWSNERSLRIWTNCYYM